MQYAVPQISMTGNSVQEHQFRQMISSAAAIFDPHGQGQKGSIVAAEITYLLFKLKVLVTDNQRNTIILDYEH